MKRFVGLVLMMMFAVHVALPAPGAVAAVALEPADQSMASSISAPMHCCTDARGQANSLSCALDCPCSLDTANSDLPVVHRHYGTTGSASLRMRYANALFRPPIG